VAQRNDRSKGQTVSFQESSDHIPKKFISIQSYILQTEFTKKDVTAIISRRRTSYQISYVPIYWKYRNINPVHVVATGQHRSIRQLINTLYLGMGA
jgi:hypothetical protein